VETRERPAPEDDDERRRYYASRRTGRPVARAEMRRADATGRLARRAGFAPEKA